MPTYEYHCDACSHRWESFQKMADNLKPTTEPCPNCKEKGFVSQIINGTPGIADPHRLGRIQPNDDWKDFTRRLKKDNPGSDFTTW